MKTKKKLLNAAYYFGFISGISFLANSVLYMSPDPIRGIPWFVAIGALWLSFMLFCVAGLYPVTDSKTYSILFLVKEAAAEWHEEKEFIVESGAHILSVQIGNHIVEYENENKNTTITVCSHSLVV